MWRGLSGALRLGAGRSARRPPPPPPGPRCPGRLRSRERQVSSRHLPAGCSVKGGAQRRGHPPFELLSSKTWGLHSLSLPVTHARCSWHLSLFPQASPAPLISSGDTSISPLPGGFFYPRSFPRPPPYATGLSSFSRPALSHELPFPGAPSPHISPPPHGSSPTLRSPSGTCPLFCPLHFLGSPHSPFPRLCSSILPLFRRGPLALCPPTRSPKPGPGFCVPTSPLPPHALAPVLPPSPILPMQSFPTLPGPIAVFPPTFRLLRGNHC